MEKIFRVWHQKRKKFYNLLHLHAGTPTNGGEWSTCEGFNCIEQKEINIQIQPDEGVISQWIGIVDENGKKIFEGDILEITDGDGWVVGHIIAGINSETLGSHQDTIGAVIGNKWENPEMVSQFCQGI